MSALFPFRALRPAPERRRPRRVGAVRRRQHRRGARARRRQPAQLSARDALGDRSAAGHHPVRRRGVRAGGAELRGAQARRAARPGRRAVALSLSAARWAITSRRACAGCFSVDEYEQRPHQEAREDAQGQGRRPHAAHRRAARADGRRVPDLSRASTAVDAHRRRASTPRRAALRLRPRPTACRTRSGASSGADRDALVAAFRDVPALYIADGHHRAASAARARDGTGATRARRTARRPVSSSRSRFPDNAGRRSCRTTASSRISPGDTPESLDRARCARAEIAGRPGTARRRRARAGRRVDVPRPALARDRAAGAAGQARRAPRRSTSKCCSAQCWSRC